jgi:hypothetical protein
MPRRGIRITKGVDVRFWLSLALAAAVAVLAPTALDARAADDLQAQTAGDPIGSVRTVKGDAQIVRAGQVLRAEVGTRLLLHDVLRTGTDASLGVVLHDETAVALGPRSELEIKDFVFKPADGLFASVVAMVKGTMVYITGRIAKLAPGAIKVETPVGVAAVRGTKILVEVPEKAGDRR